VAPLSEAPEIAPVCRSLAKPTQGRHTTETKLMAEMARFGRDEWSKRSFAVMKPEIPRESGPTHR
jgi:hypothetical protein